MMSVPADWRSEVQARPPMASNLTRWSPAAIARAFERAGDNGRVEPPDSRLRHALAKDLMVLATQLAGRELCPWASHYGRQSLEIRDDVAQDVVLKLFRDDGRMLRQWEPHLGLSLRGFIKRVVHFHVVQLFRTQCRNPWRNDPEAPQKIDQREHDVTSLQELLWRGQVRAQILDGEDERSRALYLALFVEQRSADEIAKKLGMTRDAVYQWRARFLRRVAKLGLRLSAQDKPDDGDEES